MNQNRNLATKIFDHLVKKGAELGNASILLIELVLDKELTNDLKEGDVVLTQIMDRFDQEVYVEKTIKEVQPATVFFDDGSCNNREGIIKFHRALELKTYEYGHEGGVMIVQAFDVEQAREFILSKLTENEVEIDDIPDKDIIDITNKEPGVIASFDM